MKKVIALILLMALAFGMLSSCTGSDEKADEKPEKEKNEEIKDKEDEDETVPEETEPEFQPVDHVYEDFKKLYLVPRIITAERFETAILSNIDDETDKDRLLTFYTKYDANEFVDENFASACLIAYTFPVARGNAIYVLKHDIIAKELKTLEEIITRCCPEYTHGHMAADYLLCGYTQEDILILKGEPIGNDTYGEGSVPEFIKNGYCVPFVMEAASFESMLDNLVTASETEVRDYLAEKYILIEAGSELPEGEYYELIADDYYIVTRQDAYVLIEGINEDYWQMSELQSIFDEYVTYDVMDLFDDYIRCGYFWIE